MAERHISLASLANSDVARYMCMDGSVPRHSSGGQDNGCWSRIRKWKRDILRHTCSTILGVRLGHILIESGKNMGARWRSWLARRYSVEPDPSAEETEQSRKENGVEQASSSRDEINGPPLFLTALARSLARLNSTYQEVRSRTPRPPSAAQFRLYPADSDSVVEGHELSKEGSLDDLSILSRSQLPQGRVSFWKEFTYEIEGRPYVRVGYDTSMDEVSHVMAHEWKLRLPTIVMVVISSMKQPVPWSAHRQWQNLEKGLIEAAKTTHMWIFTHGANSGVAKMLGDVVRKEQDRRKSMICHRHPKQTGNKLPDITLMGIMRDDLLLYEHMLDGKSPKVEVENEGNSEGKYELNPEHSHFVLVKDSTPNHIGIHNFLRKFEQYLIQTTDNMPPMSGSMIGRGDLIRDDKPTLGSSQIPVIALLIGGGDRCTLMVLEHLKHKTPVVIIKGSGGAADLLAFAYEEIKEKSRGDWDPDYVEHFVKSELSKKIAVIFAEYRENNLARNKFRDRLLECIRLSHQDDCIFLTFLDIHSHTIDLTELNQHLLRAMFKSIGKRDEVSIYWYDNLQKDLYLTLDWNSPHIALSEVFKKDPTNKFKVDKRIFETALLRQNREAFIDLFLDQGFQVHKFLSDKRFRRLFEKAENPEFFRTVCLEGALGYSFPLKLDKDFIQNDFNWLIKHLTKMRNYVDAQELTNNSMGMYSIDPPIAERKALTLLAMWAVLMGRPKLAKVIWKRHDHPLHLSLVVSLMYNKLVSYARETHIIKEMEDRSQEFADMAIGVLDASFQENNCRAFDILSEEIADWNYKTAVEIAADARNRHFIAHPCCQKWLTNLFFGDIRIRELKWGPIPLAVWFKVVLSAFLILPMYIWVHFKTGHKRSILGVREDESDEDSEDSDGDTISHPPLSRMCSREAQQNAIPLSVLKKKNDGIIGKKSAWDWTMLPTVTFLQYFQPRPQPPLWKKISLLWAAPITKFWTFQIFYILYLGLFSITVLVPRCGDFYLDVAVWFWTALIFLENVRKTYIQYTKYSSIPLLTRFIELFLIFSFLVLYLAVRILSASQYTSLKYTVPFISPYTARVVLCFGLLYFYYRFIWIYLPISPTLGPLLFRIKLMVTVDFMHFLRLVLLFIISGGIVIHAVIYPNFPLSNELLRRVFHRAWFTLFLTPIDDLEGKACTKLHTKEDLCKSTDNCICSNSDGSTGFAWIDNPLSLNDTDRFQCPNTGVIPYVMVIQYLIILKLILLTLLTALYSNTAQRATQNADAIWKFQRYHLVLDFKNRFRLPAPFSIISFILLLLETICHYVTCQCCRKKDEPDKAEMLKLQRLKQNDYNYWRSLAAEYSKEQEEKEKEKSRNKKMLEGINVIMSEMEFHKWSVSQLKVRITELEKIMLSSRISLEEIKREVSKEDTKIMESAVHLLSRQSPYSGTRVKRFPLADRYVPWEVMYSVYDPVVYSKPRTEFISDVRDFVDEDLLLLREQQGHIYKSPDFKWNFVFTSGGGVTIDRRSWMQQEEGQRVIYKLDSTGLPVNPMGRTGLRGRGSLYRWGPNHCILLIITRWRAMDSFMQSVNVAEDRKGLEFCCTVDRGAQLLALPGGFMMGLPSIYEVIKKQFVHDPISDCWTAETMQEYFAHFARAPAGDFVDIVGEDAEQLNFAASMILKGYIDDSRNTDNAWIEAEVWHFHYTGPQTLDNRLPTNVRWKEFTASLSAKMISSHSAIMQEVVHRLVDIN